MPTRTVHNERIDFTVAGSPLGWQNTLLNTVFKPDEIPPETTLPATAGTPSPAGLKISLTTNRKGPSTVRSGGEIESDEQNRNGKFNVITFHKQDIDDTVELTKSGSKIMTSNFENYWLICTTN